MLGWIGAGSGAAAGIAAAAMGAKIMGDANKELDKATKSNEQWYDKRYNEDYTQRADAQNAINRANEQMQKMYTRSAASNAVAGGSTEALALQKAQASNMVRDVTSGLAAEANQYKQGVESKYQSREDQIRGERMDMMKAQMQNIAAAASTVQQAGSGLMK